MAIKWSTEVPATKPEMIAVSAFNWKKYANKDYNWNVVLQSTMNVAFLGKPRKWEVSSLHISLWCCDFMKPEKMKTQMNGFDPIKSQATKGITCLQREMLRKACVWPGWRDIISAWEWLRLVPEVNLSKCTPDLSVSASDRPCTCQPAFEVCSLCVEGLQYLHQAQCSQECLDTQFLLKQKTQANEQSWNVHCRKLKLLKC